MGAGGDDDIEDIVAHGGSGEPEDDDDAAGLDAVVAPRPSRQRPRDCAADEAVGVVPGTARVWIRTMGCAHNVADSETMAGVLMSQGYRVTMEGSGGGKAGGGGASCGGGEKTGADGDKANADVWLLNSCTVKDPSEQAVQTVLREAQSLGIPVVVAGCVPQGQRNSKALIPPPPLPLPAPLPAPGAAAAAGAGAGVPDRRRRPQQGQQIAVGLLGVAQLGRVAEVVEAAVRGESMALLARGRGERALPAAELPTARRNPHVAIVPLSQGCLGACSYCKTVHARGALSSYAIEEIEGRVVAAARDPLVREICMSSEDVGAYGRDRGTTLAALLARLTRALDAVADEHGQLEEEGQEEEEEEEEAQDRGGGGGGGGGDEQRPRRRRLHRVFLRVGMSNPPFLLRDGALDAVSVSLRHPAVFRWLHLPVQSGDDGVLRRMNREYTVDDFEAVVSGLKARVPGLAIATDVIVGFPGEDDAAFEATLDLLRRHRCPSAHVTRFYPRPGTPAARYRPRVPTQVQKARTAAATRVIEGRDLEEEEEEKAAGAGAAKPPPPYSPYRHMVGTTQRVVVVDVAADGVSLVAHARANYAQVLLAPAPGLMGAVLDARVVSASRWSVRGEVVRVLYSPPTLSAEAGGGAQASAAAAPAATAAAAAAAAAAGGGAAEGAAAAAAAAARARVRAAREQRAGAARAAAPKASGGGAQVARSGDEADSAPPRDQQARHESSASLQPPATPTMLSPAKPASPSELSAEATSTAAAAPATAPEPPAAETRPHDDLARTLLSAGLLLLAAALLALGATTLRDLGPLT
jgi:threonylcarbamoyladenosine tRNA methylthiotransferase CDKAL1